jgi:hypothetical protein
MAKPAFYFVYNQRITLIVFILTSREPQRQAKGDAGNLIVIHAGTFVIGDDQAKSAVLILDKIFQRS